MASAVLSTLYFQLPLVNEKACEIIFHSDHTNNVGRHINNTTGLLNLICLCTKFQSIILYNYHHSTKLYQKISREFVAVCIVTSAQHK